MSRTDPFAPLSRTQPLRTYADTVEQRLRLRNQQLAGEINQLNIAQAQRQQRDAETYRQILSSGIPDDQIPVQLRRAGLEQQAFDYEKHITDRREEMARASVAELQQHAAQLKRVGQFLGALKQQFPEGSPQRAAAWYQFRQSHGDDQETQGLPDVMGDRDIDLLLARMREPLTEVEQLRLAKEQAEAARQTALAPFALREAEAKATTAEQQAAGTAPITPYQRAQLDEQTPGVEIPFPPAVEAQKRRLSQAGGAAAAAVDPGLVRSVLANPKTYAGLTPSTKERLIPALSAAGFQFPTADGKPPSGAERRAFGFYERVSNAMDNIDRDEPEIAKLGLAGQTWLSVAPYVLQTAVGKRFTQARDDFINASLRRESGAAISPDEYAKFDRIYFPQPGEDAQSRAQKKKSREVQLKSLERESGRAYQDFAGEEGASAPGVYLGATPTQQSGMIRVRINGNIGEIPADQLQAARKKYPNLQVIR